MLAQSGSVGCGIESTAISYKNSASIFNRMQHSPSATYSIVPNVFHDFRNSLTALNGGVRMPGAPRSGTCQNAVRRFGLSPPSGSSRRCTRHKSHAVKPNALSIAIRHHSCRAGMRLPSE